VALTAAAILAVLRPDLYAGAVRDLAELLAGSAR
jgi:hypothetical protein